jgi:hypothetical protein
MGRKKKERLDRQSNEIILFIKGGHGGLVVNAINRLFYQMKLNFLDKTIRCRQISW